MGIRHYTFNNSGSKGKQKLLKPGQALVQFCEAIFQHPPMSRILNGLQLIQKVPTSQLQGIYLTLSGNLLRCQRGFRNRSGRSL